MTRIVGFLALVTMLGPAGTAWAQDITAVSRAVATKVGELGEVKDRTLAVVDFLTSGDRMTELGSFLADQFGVALTGRARAAGYKMVTRRELCQAIRENKFWVDDRFDPELHRKLGKWTQADFIVSGRLTALQRQLAVSVRLIDSATLAEVWADSLTLALDDGLRALLSQPVIGAGCSGGAAPQPVFSVTTPPGAAASGPPGAGGGERLQVKIWADKTAYRIGETVRFGLRVNRDAYVTLVNIGTSGDVTIIYPNRFHPSHFVRAGQDVLIPPADASFTLTVHGPAGLEQIRAIATEEPIQLHAGDFGGQTAMFRSLDRVQTRNLVVGISKEREKVAPARWAEDALAVEVKR